MTNDFAMTQRNLAMTSDFAIAKSQILEFHPKILFRMMEMMKVRTVRIEN